jgi:DNA-binding Lrp family transcriptional regulator
MTDGASVELDDVDRAILYLLQRDARNSTTTEMAKQIGVSASTVGNRLRELESTGVVDGYYPDISYERIGIRSHVLLVCNAPAERRSELAEHALDVTGVVTVRELLDGPHSVHVELVGTSSEEIETSMRQLSEIGLEIIDTTVMLREFRQPFDHFGSNLSE